MKAAIGLGILFVIGHVTLVVTAGHKRLPADDWVRSAFLAVLLTRTTLAVVLLPLLIRTVLLALKGRLPAHKRIARFTIWR